ncbi:hypothetical protein [Nonomuraea fuscirosea]
MGSGLTPCPLGQAAAAQRELSLRHHVGKIVLHPPAPGTRTSAA